MKNSTRVLSLLCLVGAPGLLAGVPSWAATSYLNSDEIRSGFLDDSPAALQVERKGWQGELPALDEVIPPAMQQRLLQRRQLKSLAVPPVTSLAGTVVRAAVDLRARDTPIKMQFGGTCTAFGMIAAMENFLGLPRTLNLSEAHLWNAYRQYDLAPAVKAALGRKITDEAYWPQDSSRPYAQYLQMARTKLTGVRVLEDDVAEAVRALNRNHPVYLGLAVQTDLKACRTTIRANSPVTGGAHALAAVGYRYDAKVSGGGYFILKNSWGRECGDHGYQYLSFGACRQEGMFCLMWELTGVTRQ
jgi:hypothetical protein